MAALLFLSAFCWMMCEGTLLYLILVVVFSKLLKKWWFFLLLGYCECHISHVCITSLTVISLYTGTPLLFVVVGVASRPEYYGVHGDDDELAL